MPWKTVSTIGSTGVQIACVNLLLWLNLERGSFTPPRLRLTVQPLGPEDAEPSSPEMSENTARADRAKAVLAVALALLARTLQASAVIWLNKDIQIPTDRFIEAALPIRPRRVKTSEPGERPQHTRLEPGEVTLPDIGSLPVAPRRVPKVTTRTPRPSAYRPKRNSRIEYSLRLRDLLRAPEQIAEIAQNSESTPLRVAAWIMTVLIGIFSIPLAWVLFAFNLTTGGDFRITTNVLAATAGLSLLHAAGVTQIFLDMLLR